MRKMQYLLMPLEKSSEGTELQCSAIWVSCQLVRQTTQLYRRILYILGLINVNGSGSTVQKTHANTRAKTHAKLYFASNCDKPFITKFVRRKFLHETVIGLQNVTIGSYHSFMQNFTSHKFCDKRLISLMHNKSVHVFLHGFLHVFLHGFLLHVTARLDLTSNIFK